MIMPETKREKTLNELNDIVSKLSYRDLNKLVGFGLGLSFGEGMAASINVKENQDGSTNHRAEVATEA